MALTPKKPRSWPVRPAVGKDAERRLSHAVAESRGSSPVYLLHQSPSRHSPPLLSPLATPVNSDANSLIRSKKNLSLQLDDS